MSVNPSQLPEPASGWVRLICTEPSMNLLTRLGPTNPTVTSGYGGWEVIPRAHQVSMTVWRGVEPYRLRFDIMLDGTEKMSRSGRVGKSIEPAIQDLLAAARGDDDSEPGIIKIDGIPHVPAKRWVIEELEFQDGAIRREWDMERIRQPIMLTLLEYVPPTLLRIKRKALKNPKQKTVVIKVKKDRKWDDTPAKIARRRGCKWTDIRRLNPGVVHKANQKLKQGTKIRVPVSERRDHQDNKRGTVLPGRETGLGNLNNG